MNNPYASLFGPRRMKPNPSESEAIRDPLGRGSTLWDQEEEESDLNGKLESARADWRKDASLNSLFGVNGAFTLEDTVGKNGKNRPGDVFKVQSLLHREGLLDADKTAGPTGFLGLYDHEAIEKFQQENGLKVDGWLGPKGETIQAFQNLYAPVKSQPQQQQPQLPWKDYRPNLFDPKNWALWDKMDERERAFFAQQQGQAQHQAQLLAETLSGGAGMDDAAPVQLAQQEDGLPQPQDRGAQAPEPDNLEPEKAAPDKAAESAGDIADALGLDTKKIDLTNPDIQAALIGTRFYNYFDPQTQQKTLSQVEKIKSIDPKLHGKLRSAVADSRASPIWQPTLLTDEQLEKHLEETKRSREWLERLKTVSDSGKIGGNIPGVQLPSPVAFGNSGFSLLLELADISFGRALQNLEAERQRRQKN